MARAKDSSTGLVELFNPEGGRIRFARYSQVSTRKQLVEGWLADCSGPGYTLAITPDIDLPPWEMAEVIREENWRELKRKMGISAESADAGLETVAENAPVSDFEAPSCHDLDRAVGWERLVQIDAKIEALQKTA